MAGLNTTGLPKTQDYVLGRGIIYFSPLDAITGLPDTNGYRDLGNAPSFTMTVETEELEHQSSRTGLKITDARFVVSQTANISFSLDEINFQNLAMFLSGTTSAYSNPHNTTMADVIQATDVVLGRWYDLKNAAGARLYDLAATGLVMILEKDDTVDVLLVAGTDYTLDAKFGRVMILSTAVNIAAGDALSLTITTGATVQNNVDQVNGLTTVSLAGALKFIGENAGDGEKIEAQFHKVRISASGDFAFISDEVTVMEFEGVAETNSAVPDTSKVVTIRYP